MALDKLDAIANRMANNIIASIATQSQQLDCKQFDFPHSNYIQQYILEQLIKRLQEQV